MVEHLAQLGLAGIINHAVGNGADGLVGELGCSQCVGIELGADFLDGGQCPIAFGIGDGRSPMCQIVLRHRHRFIGENLFHLGQVHFVGSLAFLQGFHERLHVKHVVAVFHVLPDQAFGHGPVGIKRQFGRGGVTIHATAVRQYLGQLLVDRKVGRRSLVHSPVGDGQHRDYHHQGQENL